MKNLFGCLMLLLVSMDLRGAVGVPGSTLPDLTVVTGDDALFIIDDLAGTPVTKKVTAQRLKAFPGLEHNLGTVANGGTATLVLATNLYRGVFSGATATIALPAITITTNGYWFEINGTNTSGGTQILIFPLLYRREIKSGVTTVTNEPAADFTLRFLASDGAWKWVQAEGDALTIIAGLAENIGGFTSVPTSVLTCDTAGAYAFGDNFSGLVTITNAFRANGSSGLASTFTFLSNDDTAPELTVLLFSRPVTLASANATSVISNADMAYCGGSFRLTPQDYVDLGTNRVASRLNLNFAVNNTFTNRYLYLAFIAGDTTQVTNQPVCTFGILQD